MLVQNRTFCFVLSFKLLKRSQSLLPEGPEAVAFKLKPLLLFHRYIEKMLGTRYKNVTTY